ncbi:DUF924 family protein [Magnetofaba australis]|uniref:Transmembrane protein n=1 Tax=Magnetofaba australis IT-1 TaxID=1434232 RepID=A0A1Y2JZ73_9PROT|nr:DUF924 family protein [Magnetofaba australis]OSM00186.1 hypothetical protein MAIT1_00638 [Magnetofaba australis IT-1]
MIAPAAQAVLDFWFGAEGDPEYGQPRRIWFQQDAAFDAEIVERFGALHAEAAAGALSDWMATPHGALARIIVLDQFSRNLHRDDGRAFACDPLALTAAKFATERGDHRLVLPVMAGFFLLPFEHSENLADQDHAITLFTELDNEQGLLWARRHRDVIARFGRFPHRNAALGRENTPEETAFLTQPGSRF